MVSMQSRLRCLLPNMRNLAPTTAARVIPTTAKAPILQASCPHRHLNLGDFQLDLNPEVACSELQVRKRNACEY